MNIFWSTQYVVYGNLCDGPIEVNILCYKLGKAALCWKSESQYCFSFVSSASDVSHKNYITAFEDTCFASVVKSRISP